MCATTIQSSRDFLKSAQGKILNNKRKAEPDMRVEALLGSACKRIRCEIKAKNNCEKKGQFINETKPASLETVTDLLAIESSNSFCFDFNDDCSEDFIGLLDDPKQVEIFLRQVENQCQTGTNKERKIESVENVNSFYDFSEKISSFPESVSAELDLYTNFESLYDELIDSLASVEKWMTLAASADTTNTEGNHSFIYADQNETMIDLSSLFDSAK